MTLSPQLRGAGGVLPGPTLNAATARSSSSTSPASAAQPDGPIDGREQPLALSPEQLDQLCGLFKLLSDKTRLTVLQMLSAGEMNVTALCERLQLPQPTVSHHLGLLRNNRLIDNRRSGKQVFYRLNGRISPVVPTAGEAAGDVGVKIDGRGFAVQLLSQQLAAAEGSADAAGDPRLESKISHAPEAPE